MMLLLYSALLICLSQLSASLESPEPEVLLQPRNFNPHPYQQGVRLSPTISSRRGPVLFPEDSENNASPLSRQPLLSVVLPVAQSSGVENHPYANVARKHRIKLAGRFSPNEQENNINPQVYSGLANYAAKVLKKPSAVRNNNGYVDVTLAGQKKDYAFSYAVRDKATGDDFSHRQSHNAKATQGEYRVKLPDGRVQIVSYTADKNGYKADVTYTDDFPAKPHQVKQPDIVPVAPAPSPVPVPVADYDYNYDQNIQYNGHGQHVGNPLTQIEVPLYQDNPTHFQIEPVTQKFYQNGQRYVTIYPALDELQKHSRQYVPRDKVQIYTQGEQKLDGGTQSETNIQSLHRPVQYDAKVFDIGGGTLVPYTAGHILKGYGGNILVSTVAPEQYSGQVYITTPRYNVLPPTQHYYQKR